jgi:hypothetical protein
MIMTIPVPANLGKPRGHVPYEDLKLTIDRSGTSVTRSFTVETRIDVADDADGRAFWDTLVRLLDDPSQRGHDAVYQHVFAFANQFLLAPGAGRGHAILQAALGQIDVNASRIPAVPEKKNG